MNIQTGSGPPTGGIFDLNLTLNFAPQMRKEYLDFLHTTRDMAMAQLFDVQWYSIAGVAFVVGFLFATLIACLFAAWGRARSGTAVGLLLAMLLATPQLAAQPPDPREPMVDLVTLGYVPKNVGSRINQAGCCVFASQTASFVSQYNDDMADYMKWVAANLPGGGYPSRVTEYMEAYCRARNIQVPDYTQIVGDDAIAAISEALEDGRAPAVTYSGDPSFYGGPVPHMVNCVYLDQNFAGIVDNNRPGSVEWMSRETFVKRHRHFDRGWAIVYHGKPQLPRPTNPDGRPRHILPQPRDPFNMSLRASLDPGGQLLIGDCEPCRQPQRRLPTQPATQPATQSGYWWHGDVLYRDGCRIGEMKNGQYHEYHGDGSGRSWLAPANCPATLPNESRPDRPTGVDYAKVPAPLPGRTYYGTASSDLRYDDAGRRLFETRMHGDRSKPRIIINIDGAADVVEDILRRLAALEKVFVYARDAIEVIRRLGYGPGITVVSGTTRGVAQEVAYFATIPTDAELAQALMRADPSYRPGSSGLGSMSGDMIAFTLIGVIAMLALCVVYLVTRKAGSSDA